MLLGQQEYICSLTWDYFPFFITITPINHPGLDLHLINEFVLTKYKFKEYVIKKTVDKQI